MNFLLDYNRKYELLVKSTEVVKSTMQLQNNDKCGEQLSIAIEQVYNKLCQLVSEMDN